MDQMGRHRATRIALDYHRQRDDLWQRRMLAAAIALCLALAYVAYAELAPRGQTIYTRGSLSHQHARWDANCQACHDDFRAIHAQAWSFDDAGREILQKKCTTCHAVAGHHGQMLQRTAFVHGSCSACHHEHQGRGADLTKVDDQACATCHQQLDRTRRTETAELGVASVAPHITRFARDGHPQFRSLSEDLGNVKFNHALHLLAGVQAPDSRDPGLTYGEIGEKYSAAEREAFRHQYRPKSGGEDQRVQLSCADCHSLTSSTETSARSVAREQAYMQPIRYETHCKACHVLDYTAGVSEQMIPHGITLAEIRSLLRVAEDGFDAAHPEGSFVESALVHLQRKCEKCHDIDAVAGPVHQVVAPPQRWLQHGRFHHGSHTGTACTTCHVPTAAHGGGAANLIDGGTDQERVMIENMDVCLKCHDKSDSRGSIARADCIECHRYHVDPMEDSDYGVSTNRPLQPVLPK